MPLETNTLEGPSAPTNLEQSSDLASSSKRKLPEDISALTEGKRQRQGEPEAKGAPTQRARWPKSAITAFQLQKKRIESLELQLKDQANNRYELAQSRKDISQLKAENEDLLAKNRTKVFNLSNELALTKIQLEESKGREAMLQRNEVSILATQRGLKSANTIMQKKLDRLEHGHGARDAKANSLAVENAGLKLDYIKAMEEISGLRETNTNLCSQMGGLKTQNEALQKQLATMQEEINQYKQQLEKQVGAPAQPISQEVPEEISEWASMLFNADAMDRLVEELNI